MLEGLTGSVWWWAIRVTWKLTMNPVVIVLTQVNWQLRNSICDRAPSEKHHFQLTVYLQLISLRTLYRIHRHNAIFCDRLVSQSNQRRRVRNPSPCILRSLFVEFRKCHNPRYILRHFARQVTKRPIWFEFCSIQDSRLTILHCTIPILNFLIWIEGNAKSGPHNIAHMLYRSVILHVLCAVALPGKWVDLWYKKLSIQRLQALAVPRKNVVFRNSVRRNSCHHAVLNLGKVWRLPDLFARDPRPILFNYSKCGRKHIELKVSRRDEMNEAVQCQTRCGSAISLDTHHHNSLLSLVFPGGVTLFMHV